MIVTRIARAALAGAVIFIASTLFLAFAGAVFCAGTLNVSRNFVSAPPNATTITLVAGDKANLSAWWLQSFKPNGNCVIVLHGIGDSRGGSVRFAPMFLDHGYAVLVPDSRAHGASEGKYITYGLLEKYDVIAWTDWMRSAGCHNIYGLGESLGASVLIQAASVQPTFAAIVAECAFADLRDTADFRVRQMLRMPAWVAVLLAKMVVGNGMLYADLVDGLSFREVSPLRSIAAVVTPILLIHGLSDLRTPPYNSEKLASANPQNQLWLVPRALHTGAMAAEPDEFRRRVLGWFAEH